MNINRYPIQDKFVNSDADSALYVSGRQAGKTVGLMRVALKFLDVSDCVFIAPTQDMCREAQDRFCEIVRDSNTKLIEQDVTGEVTISSKRGRSTITFKSGIDGVDAIYSPVVLVDEINFLSRGAISEIAAQMERGVPVYATMTADDKYTTTAYGASFDEVFVAPTRSAPYTDPNAIDRMEKEGHVSLLNSTLDIFGHNVHLVLDEESITATCTSCTRSFDVPIGYETDSSSTAGIYVTGKFSEVDCK